MNMKPAMQNESGSWQSPAALVAMALVTAFFMTACGNKDSSPAQWSAAPPMIAPMPVGPVCTGCTTPSSFLVSAVGRVYTGAMGGTPAIEMGLQFFGDANVIGNSIAGGWMGAGNQSYYGPAAGEGILTLAMPPSMLCNIPQGIYTLVSSQVGNWGMDGAGRSFNAIQMDANSGPVPIRIAVMGYITPATPPARISSSQAEFPYRIAGYLRIQRLDAPTATQYCDYTLE